MVDTQPSKISLDNIQGLVDRIPRGIPLPMNKSELCVASLNSPADLITLNLEPQDA